ncbi:MAG: hypothetical protein V4574_16370 [Pseudomonadota bacterium]
MPRALLFAFAAAALGAASPVAALGAASPVVALGTASPAGAQDAAGPAVTASVEALAAGAAACATSRLSQDRMAERLAAAGWTARAADVPGKDMAIRSYARQDVTLFYFTSKPMTQCVARGAVPADYRPDALLAALTAQLGKPPRTDQPGRRYLYSLPRLDILTVQIKSDAMGPHVELAVVH